MRGVPQVMFVLAALLLMAGVAIAADPTTSKMPQPPKARQDNVVDTVQGVKIADPYRWMEDASSPETKRYVEEQWNYTRSVLDPLPGRDKIHARLDQLLHIGTLGTPQVGGDLVFYTRREGEQNQPVLYVREGAGGKDRALADVNGLANDGTVALDWWYASHDGKYVAYGTSPSGSEISTLHVVEVATGKLLPDEIPQTRAASLGWKPDDTGFYYTRYPAKGTVPAGQEMYNRHVFYHALGSDPAKDPQVFGEGLDAQDWPNVDLSDDGRWLTITVQQGWTKSELYLKDVQSDAPAVKLTTGKNFLYQGGVFKGDLYVLTNEDAPRSRMFKVAASAPQRENWKELIPESDGVLQNYSIIGGQVFGAYEKNASSLLKVFSTDGKLVGDIPLPTIGTVLDDNVGGNWESKDAYFAFMSYTVPPSIYRYDVASKKAELWTKVEAPVDPSAYEVKQVWYPSKDGTKVPMFIVGKKGYKLDGHNPTLLTGYGGFNVSETPQFNRGVYLWLEHGGLYAVANLRGGSEFGEDWHRAGMLGKKQNVFDDFIAAAEYLENEHYTDRQHLAIEGRSNGGLLVGAALTQRPDLYKAVICGVPLLDMLRYQNFQIAKLWIPEYGSADDPAQFKWLYAYSPYHHVKEGTKYPATLLLTADSDSRVDPMHAKKMAARLQEANRGGGPILLRVDTKAGHGQGKPVAKQVEEGTDVWSFLFWQLGVTP